MTRCCPLPHSPWTPGAQRSEVIGCTEKSLGIPNIPQQVGGHTLLFCCGKADISAEEANVCESQSCRRPSGAFQACGASLGSALIRLVYSCLSPDLEKTRGSESKRYWKLCPLEEDRNCLHMENIYPEPSPISCFKFCFWRRDITVQTLMPDCLGSQRPLPLASCVLAVGI